MKIKVKKSKINFPFIIFCVATIVVILIISLITDSVGNKLDEVELTNNDVTVNGLVINEIMTSNGGIITDESGKLYDYVEIYNGTDKDINLKDYGLSDNSQVQWAFPNVTIESKGYIVVFLSGTTEQGLYAPFKLKTSGEETVTLFKPNGKVIDAVVTVELDKNTVMARNEEGKWVIQDSGTPGFANTTDGHESFLASLMTSEDKTIIINEVLPNNKGNFKNENGEYSGYIELKNVSDKTINIANYSLSNDEDASFKWQLPSISLSPNEVVGIYTSGKSSKSSIYSTSFKLNSKNGSAVLTNNKGKVIDKVNYSDLGNGIALVYVNGSYSRSSSISFGYDNTIDGIKNFQKKYMKVNNDLVINEAMNSNYKYLAQNGNNYYDWIELYNNSNKTIKLSDYCLTTDVSNICMYKLPDVELEKGKYYVVIASGNENLSNKSYKHTNFKLSDSESLYLSKSNEVIDSMFISEIPTGYSIGKSSNYGIYYFKTPTPGKSNSDGTQAVSYTPTSSYDAGRYDKSIKVTLSGGDTIYYTLDGSEPTTSSKVYSSPLSIKKTTVLRIMAKSKGMLKSEIKTYTYLINEDTKLNVMSLAINPSKLNNVNSHTALNSSVIEESYIQYFDQDSLEFEIGAGLKLFGGSTRSYRKKSYEIKFKKEYGKANLEYKVFDTVDSSVFNSLVLRTGSQDEFQWTGRSLIRDIVATSLVDEYTNVDVQAYVPIVLYINGKYWGLYFIREKVDESFVANHYNVEATEKNTSILRIDGEVKSGTDSKYKSMINFINNNSLSNSANYKKVKEQIDIENLCDFWIAEIWPSNYDIVNTRYFSNPNVDNGKWKFIYYDLDSAFYNVKENYYQYYTNPNGIGYGYFPTTLLRNLMKSSEFKKTFLERLSYNLKNTWSAENVNKKIDEVIAEIGEDEIKRNLERWDVTSYSNWKSNIKDLREFANNRNSYMVSQAKSYFGLSNSEVKKYFGDVK